MCVCVSTTICSSGNKDTLDTLPKEQGINVRDALLQFHAKWYSSNIMALSVLGKGVCTCMYVCACVCVLFRSLYVCFKGACRCMDLCVYVVLVYVRIVILICMYVC